MFLISNNKRSISHNFKVLGPLAGKFDFFGPSVFEIQSDSDYKTSNYPARVLKLHLNEKNLMHGPVTKAG